MTNPNSKINKIKVQNHHHMYCYIAIALNISMDSVWRSVGEFGALNIYLNITFKRFS